MGVDGEEPGRNQRGVGRGGSLSGCEHGEVGSVWAEAQGLLAWVLVEALFSTGVINTQVLALYFAGKLYLCFQYFSEITCISSVQFSSVAQSCLTLCNPMDCSSQASLSITNSQSLLKLISIGDSLVAQTVKRLPAMRDTRVQSPGLEDPLEKEMATHSSTLA